MKVEEEQEEKFTCCRSEAEDANLTRFLAKSQYTDTGPTNPATD